MTETERQKMADLEKLLQEEKEKNLSLLEKVKEVSSSKKEGEAAMRRRLGITTVEDIEIEENRRRKALEEEAEKQAKAKAKEGKATKGKESDEN